MILTDKQEMFCQEYLIDLNATQACIRAGYSEKTAKEIGYENLTKPHILEKIAELKAERNKALKITATDVLKRLQSWVESDITETLTLTPQQVKDLPLAYKQLITSYKSITGNGTEKDTVEVKMVSKEKAQEMINRHIGFYEKDNSQTSSIQIITPKAMFS